MLELQDIHYQPATSNKAVLKGVNLKIDLGVPTIITGASGSGKTSLIEIISGLSSHKKGSISWKGRTLRPRERRVLCGMVFQFPERHFLGLTIAQELRLGHRRLSTEKQINILKLVGLENVDLTKPPEVLSGGQQRRLAIAVQLLKEPNILLLDEPTAGLDWSVKNEIIDLLYNISKYKLIIIVTHESELFKSIKIVNTYQLINGRIECMPRFKEESL